LIPPLSHRIKDVMPVATVRPSRPNRPRISFPASASLLLAAAFFLGACAGPEPYTYKYKPGFTATMQGPYAVPPPAAPPQVQAAIAAGNRITGLPYRHGGGHGNPYDNAYDCSGAASYILQAAGALDGPRPSSGFLSYGERGKGDWISVYARKGHVFLVVAGLRFDTGWTNGSKGPQWTTRSRPAKGYRIRHPEGL
jgi:hypothetical protein